MISIKTPIYYTATRKYELSFPSLETDLDADVVVIGGGFSGINTALELAKHDTTDIVVLETRRLGFGGTGRDGGQITVGTDHDLEKIRKDIGEDSLRAIFEISDLGANIIKGRIEKYAINAGFYCDYGYMDFDIRQARTLQTWEKEFRSFGSPHEIRYLHGAEMHQAIGSGIYDSTLLHMDGDHVHSLNLLFGEARTLASLGARIPRYSSTLEVQYDEHIHVRTAKDSVTANEPLRACDGFLNRLRPELRYTTINIHVLQMMTEPLSGKLIQRISSIRSIYSDIRPIIDYYRVTNGNRLLFGTTTLFIKRTSDDLRAQNRKPILKIFPCLEHVRISLAWDGPMACSANLFPQIDSFSGQPNAFSIRGHSGFGMTPNHIVRKALAEGIGEGSAHYNPFNSVHRIPIHGKNHFRLLLFNAGRI